MAQAMSDRGINPNSLHQAIRANTSQGPYARGAEDSMRSMARFGEDVATVMGKPSEAKLLVRGLSDTDKQAFRSTFTNKLMQDAARQDDATGEMILHGPTLKRMLTEQAETLDAMGVSATDRTRLNHIADTVMMVQRQSPEQLNDLFADGPATLMQLAAAISGAKWGQAASAAGPGPTGIGSSLVLAQFGSRTMRRALSSIFDDASYKLLVAASQPTADGRKLYQAMLTTPLSTVKQQEKAGSVILGYIYPGAAQGAQDIKEVLSQPENREELMGIGRQVHGGAAQPMLERIGVRPPERLRGLLSPEPEPGSLLQ
jgi:hypothetical protein